jgi:outer membrane protein OmpA-like peptidoglycan-associated protein
MVKGVKKIKWSGVGTVKKDLSTPNKKVVIAPDQHVFFEVEKWYDTTPETDRKKSITWIFQDQKAKTIVLQKTLPANNRYGIKLPKNLCGPFEYYLEASLSGKRDVINQTGLLISGYCPAKIVSSKWCTTNDGKDVRKDHFFNYGETVYLNLMTEGLNGNLNLSIDIFRNISGKDDPCIFRYTSVDVIDGEVNLAIKNTLTWHSKIKDMKESEEFYVKVFDPANKIYITDNNNDTIHARFLRIKKKAVPQEIKPPTNMSPLKTGEPDKNATRFEPCKFETITIIEDKKEDGKTTKIKTLLFDNGKKLINKTPKKEPLKKTILFEFEKYDITPDAKTVLNNTLQFLLEHQFSSIKIDGHACVIGKENYNHKLSQQRSDAVKKVFVDGGLDARLITSVGHGEVNPTDDKQGRDNLKYRDEKEYKQNRCVDIAFDYYGHDAQTIIYETIAPSKDKNITIDITEYQNKACFREKGKHTKNIKITSPEYQNPIDRVTDKLDFPVKSNLSFLNPLPLQYIWPKVLENEYNIHVHSCRYFSVDSNPTIKVMVYPDIKWELAFELKIDVKNYSHNNMPPEHRIFEKHQKIATKEGYKRWLMNKNGEIPIVVGIGLKAEWDEAQRKISLTKEWEKKTELLAKKLSKSIELIQSGINVCRGVLETTSIPLSFEVKYPKFEAVGSWYLQKEDDQLALAIVGKINFGAKPFIGASVTIDLIAAAVTVASYSTTGSPAISKIVQKIRNAGKKVGAEIAADAKFYGEIEIMFNDITINSIKGTQGGNLLIGGKMGMKLIVEVKAGNNPWYRKKSPILTFEALARATGDAYFGGEMKIDSDDKGIYIEPTLKFSGLEVTFEAEVTIGWFKDGVEKKYSEVVPKKEIKLNKHYLN